MTRNALRPATPAALLAISVGLATPGPSRVAEAGPTVQVRARTAITLEPIRRDRGGLIIRGRVHERGSDQAVAFESGTSVTISLDDRTAQVLVDDDGRFGTWFATRGGRHRLDVQFSGNDRFDASAFTMPELDVAKQPLVLSLRVPEQHRRSGGSLWVEVQASGEYEAARVTVAVHVGGAELDELPLLGRYATSSLGRAPLVVPVARLGGPGPKLLRASFAGDDTFDPATVEASFVVLSATKLGFASDETEVRFEGRVRGRGRLIDDMGAPLAGQPISLVADLPGGRRVLDDTLTGVDGEFALDAPASELGPGKHLVQAMFESPRSFLETSRSSPVRITVAERRPVPVGYSLAAFAATAMSIVAFVALRTRPWQRWITRLRGQSAGPTAGTSDERDAPPHTGLSLARPGLVSTLRRPHDRGFTGRVADAVTGEPIAGASVELGQSAAHTGDDGRFELEELPDGDHRAVASCEGYVTESFAVTIPHRGELRDARIDLLPVRERIFQLYREVAEPLLPRPDLWGVWTPRQIFEHVRRAHPARALSGLTDYVEEKYFSARSPTEAELPAAAAQVAAVRDEAAAPPAPSK